MAITMPAVMTSKTHSALLAYREHMEAAGYDFTLSEASGNLISEALQANGFLNRPEYVKQGELYNASQS